MRPRCRRSASKGLRVGLDVSARRPAAATGEFTMRSSVPGVYGTHHIGASTDQAQEAIAAETVRIVARTRKRTGAQRRQSRAEDPGDAHARRPPSRSSGRARPRVRRLRGTISTCRRPRISCSRVLRPLSRGSTSIASPTRADRGDQAWNADVLDLQLVKPLKGSLQIRPAGRQAREG